MKRLLLFSFLSMLLAIGTVKATNVVIIESQSYGHTMDATWQTVCSGLGYTANIYPQTKLDSTNWFASTDILIVSSGVIPLTSTGDSTIQSFLQQGGKVYLQCEYLTTYTTNIAFQQIVDSLGGAFAWQGEATGNLNPMNVFGSLSNAPNSGPIAPLSYYWYGTYGAGLGCDSHIEPFLEYQGQYYGFIFCDPSNTGRMITTSDQDWVQSQTSIPLMTSILTNLISPTYSCISANGGINVNLGPDTSICAGQAVYLDATTTGALSYTWSTGAGTATISASTPGTYWVNVATSSCTGSDTIVISSLQNVPLTYLLADSQFCAGNSTTITLSLPNAQIFPSTSVSWLDSVVAILAPDSTTSYAISALSCAGNDSAVATVHVIQPPVFTQQLSQTQICAGDSSLLTISGLSFAHISPSSGVNWLDSTHAYLHPGNSTTYLVTGIRTCAGPDTATVQLNVFNPYVNLGPDTSICTGQLVNLNATTTGATAYQWSTNQSTPGISVSAPGSYWVIVSASGCTGSDTIVVTQLSGNSFSYTLSDTMYCAGGSTTISISVPHSIISPAAPVAWLDSVQALISPDSTTIYSISNLSCNGADTSTFTLHIIAPSVFSHQLAQPLVCFGDSALLTLSGISYSSISPLTGLSWHDSTHVYLQPDSTTTYFIRGVRTCAGPDSATVLLSVAHPAVIAHSNSDTLCGGDTALICATGGFSSYTWNLGDTSACTRATLQGNYYLTVTDQNNCTAQSNIVPLFVFPQTPVTITENGDSFIVYNDVSCQWYENGIAIPGATANLFIAQGSGLYSVSTVDGNGCTNYSSQFHYLLGIENISAGSDISVFPNPLASGNWQLSVTPEWIGSTAELFDDNGRSILKAQVHSEESQISTGLAKGVYLLRIYSSTRNAVRKLVKL